MRSWLLMLLLVLSILIHDAQGVRLISTRSAPSAGLHLHSLHQKKFEEMRDNEGEWKSKKLSGKRERKLHRVRKESKQNLPRIHEEYYGPRMHRSKHH